MQLKVKDMDIATGGVQVAIVNHEDAHLLDLHHMDRVVLKKGDKKTVATIDIGESEKAVPKGQIGLFEEVLDAIGAKQDDAVILDFAEKPESVYYIKKKMDGKSLNSKEIHTIIKDIVDNKLTDIELTSFVVASYSHGMSLKEITYMTRSMAATGDQLKFDGKAVIDLHSIGGVPGNRTTMLMVPLLVAGGCIIPKTSSRAITSPAGTADTMEVLCSVSMNMQKLKKIIDDVGGFIVWGGAVNLAPADDKIIQVEHPLNIDAEGQMIASILAKKASVGATHLLLELPIGNDAKVKTRKEAVRLGNLFVKIGKKLGIKVKIVVTQGTKPIGKGIGPVLEARDVLWALKCDERAPKDLVKKSLELTGILFEFVGKTKKGKGKTMAAELLKNGSAYNAMERIVEAQGGKMPEADSLKPGSFTYTFQAVKSGKLLDFDNHTIAKAARLAGAPIVKESGVYLHENCGNKLKKGQKILTVHANSKRKLEYAVKILKKTKWVTIR